MLYIGIVVDNVFKALYKCLKILQFDESFWLDLINSKTKMFTKPAF